MEKSILERFGFKYNKRSVHTGRTIMLEELSNLLEAVPDAIVYDDYIKAIIDQNCLLKRSSSSRTITANFLTELYSLDPTISIFRNLLFFWNRDEEGRPLLAMLCAFCRDRVLNYSFKAIKSLEHMETELLERYVRALETSEATDPKYDKTVELLRDENWIERGTIIFSQYFDTAKWIAENLSKEFDGETIGLYAGGDKSGIFIDGVFKRKDKEELKAMVKSRDLRILVGTDSASEGLNLQTLGSLINIDLPWNPTRLEQRKGRIQRIGQVHDTIFVYNMRYKDSVEDRVHNLLSQRLRNIYNVFGQLPDVLEDVWINVAIGEQEKALEIIDNVPEKHPFENRYNMGVEHIDWESCSEVLDKKEKREFLKKGWIRCMNV